MGRVGNGECEWRGVGARKCVCVLPLNVRVLTTSLHICAHLFPRTLHTVITQVSLVHFEEQSIAGSLNEQ